METKNDILPTVKVEYMFIDALVRAIKRVAQSFITVGTKCKKDRILLLYESNSGSNTYALFKLVSDELNKKYDIVLLGESEPSTLFEFVKKYALLASAKLIITTHASYKPSKKHIHFQLWHGPFVKKNGIMVPEESKNMLSSRSAWRKADYIMSYSETYTTFMNACMVTHPSKYIVSGAPRNDLLFLSNGKSNMKRIYGDQIDGYKTILFMPTFRKDSNVNLSFKSIESLFGFDQFSLERFDQFLEANNCKLIFKPHPHSEDVVFRLLDNYSLSNLLVLKNEDLVKNSLDLYELINATEMLITDYSSVFYDYLLIDRPIIFTPTDINSYEQDRGFVIESFASWIPGPKAVTQDELQVEITNCLLETDYYADKRAWLRDLNHRYKDGNSSDRLWSFIEKIMPTH